MMSLLLLSALIWQSPPLPDASTAFFRYQRDVIARASTQSCAVVDAAVFAHAAPFLKDLRLYTTADAYAHEVPYVLIVSEAQQAESESARILNLGQRGRAVTFDLAMPQRPYTDVALDLAGRDFIVSASVIGTQVAGSASGTSLGRFTLFDLTSQNLARSSTLHLQESSFPFLHITLTSLGDHHGTRLSPQTVRGANVPPSREAQTLFTVAASTTQVAQRARDTVARFSLPERVPIERVSFTLQSSHTINFSRDVEIVSHALDGGSDAASDLFTGRIERVNLTREGHEISENRLSVPATLGANLQSAAEVEVLIHNGDDPPLPIASVQLEMRQRQLCFPALPEGGATLFYGDPKLTAPQYDLSRTFVPGSSTSVAHLGPERLNRRWHPRSDDRPYTERHPHLLWIALLGMICSLAMVAFHSSRSLPR